MAASTFLGIETTLRGLTAAQRALETTGNNISNANTPGYTRERAQLEATPSYEVMPGQQLGTGVDISGYTRIRDAFIDTQLRTQMGLQGSAQTQQDGLGQVESVLNEPSSAGLSSLLSKYWSSWQDVVNSPEDPATRQALVESAKSLADGFNTISNQLSTMEAQISDPTSGSIAQMLVQVNQDDAASIKRLNDSIKAASLSGSPPNDLLDQRDALVDDLSKYGNVQTTSNADGTMTVTFDGVTLVDSTQAYTLSVSGSTISNNMATPQTQTVASTWGKIGGELELLNTTLPGYQSQLDGIANVLITQTNALQSAGYGLGGSTGNPFFSGTDASSIAVAATATQVAASATGAVGDNANAIQIADLAGTQFGALGGATIDGAYAQLVTSIGADSQAATRSAGNATAIVNSLKNQRDAVSGVSIDEEMTNLVRFQQAYQASARAMNTLDSVLQTLITRAL